MGEELGDEDNGMALTKTVVSKPLRFVARLGLWVAMELGLWVVGVVWWLG